jgi:hypothetical protein
MALGENLGHEQDIAREVTLNEGSYLRIEAEARRGENDTRACTNPIWVDAR